MKEKEAAQTLQKQFGEFVSIQDPKPTLKYIAEDDCKMNVFSNGHWLKMKPIRTNKKEPLHRLKSYQELMSCCGLVVSSDNQVLDEDGEMEEYRAAADADSTE